MHTRTLVLTPWYLPYRVVCWEHAITLMYLKKVELLVAYDDVVRSPSVTMPLPAVIRMCKKVTVDRHRIRFSRANVFMRDGFRCMYCGSPYDAAELTLDHVVPRSQGGRTSWDNIVTACEVCNARKGNQTPGEAGMVPLRSPFKPNILPPRPSQVRSGSIPPEWRAFYPAVETSNSRRWGERAVLVA